MTVLHLLLFLTLYIFITCANDTILTLKTDFIYDLYHLNLNAEVGKENYNLYYFEIDLKSDYPIFDYTIFNNENISEYIYRKLIMNHTAIPCKQITYPFYISGHILNFTFLNIINDCHYSYKQHIITFPFLYNKQFSLLDKAVEDGHISRRTFALGANTEFSGVMYIGGIPSDVLKGTFDFTVNVKSAYKTWGFNIDSVYLHNFSRFNNSEQYLYIQPRERGFFAPLSFMKYLNDTYFNVYYNEEKCYYRVIDMVHYIECLCGVFDTFSYINFEVEGKVLSISFNKLVQVEKVIDDRKDEICALKIKHSEKDEYYEDKNKFIVGTPFIDSYLTQFDYDKKTITMYSHRPFIGTKEKSQINNHSKYIQLFHITNISINILCVIIMIIQNTIK